MKLARGRPLWTSKSRRSRRQSLGDSDRIFRAANELGLKTVAIWTEEDKLTLHRFKADESYRIGRGPHLTRDLGPIESYLSIDEIIRAASGSLAWTIASIAASGAAAPRQRRLLLAGPLLMAAGLAVLATLLASTAPTYALIPAVIALGAGIGQSWPLVGPIIMNGAGPGDEAVAASAVPTVQQTGFALGAALAGVVANASGFSPVMTEADFERAAFRIFACFIAAAGLAGLAGFELMRRLSDRSAGRLEADM